ncbi:hypothetical protein HGA91_03420 [candidate division WWE3 bacterium]|nr:hypothetical protein [candidate division WWE3 bacterium]
MERKDILPFIAVISGVLIFFVLAASLPVGRELFRRLFPKPESKAYVGQLSMPAQINAAGSSIEVPITLNTNGSNVVGVDISINFSIARLQLTDIVTNGSSHTLKSFLPADSNGNLNKSSVMQSANQTGSLRFSAVNVDPVTKELLAPYSGSQTITQPLATLVFNVSGAASTNVTFDFTLGNLNDTNLAVVGTATDSLENVQNATIVFANATVTPAPYSADINQDGTVNVFDLGVLAANYNKTIDSSSTDIERRADINQDTVVNVFDLGILASQYGTSP